LSRARVRRVTAQLRVVLTDADGQMVSMVKTLRLRG